MNRRDARLYPMENARFDPAKWVSAALQHGLRLELRPDGWLVVDVMDAEELDAMLFMGWLGDHHEELALYLVPSEGAVH